MRLNHLAYGASAVVIALAAASAASAQSTGTLAAEGTTEVEELVITGVRGPRSLAGAIVAEQEPKSRSTITQEYIGSQAAGQTILNSINLIPGVNFTNNDAYGSSGGDITMRGFDAARISLTADGIPLNDTGNYAIYSNQQLDPELIERAGVNLGTTDVDSPTASATGGTINYVTRRPSRDPGLIVQPSVGGENYGRIFALVETGEFGPWGTRAWASISRTEYDHFKDPGGIEKTQYNGRIYQPLGDNGDFVSLVGHYNENRNSFTRRVTLAQFEQGIAYDQSNTLQASYTAFNPSNTGNIRGQSRFTLGDSLTLTIDPSFQYVLANGGGTQTINETDPQIRGNSGAAGVDLNGNGVIGDTVVLHRPNNTQTHRYGVTSSLIWQPNDNNQVRAAYTYDRGDHRQTGEMGFLDEFGRPLDVFAGRKGPRVELPDGTILRRRDRQSYAILNQIALEYRGTFLNDTVDLLLGVRAPFFDRELNNYCYQRDTFNAYCTTQTPTETNAAGEVRFPASALNPGGNAWYGVPRSFEKSYEAVLPNLGVNWRFAPNHTLYGSYAEGFSAPRTDDLYDRVIPNPEPETTDSYDLGYRYQSGSLIASVAIWRTDYANRIVRTYDEAADLFLTRNVGDVTLQGVDGQIGFSPIDALTLYGSFTYTDSEVQNDLPSSGGVFIPTAGNQLVETPDWQFGFRADYEIGDWNLGLQGKYVGERYSNDINTEVAPDYTVWDMDVRYRLNGLGTNSWLQLNVINLLDEEYLADISTSTSGTAQYQVGAPRTAMLTLRAAF